jgi:hypothetical protein
MRYRLRVELDDITPMIWRELWVEGEMTLGQLHHILQATMGWTDAHLHGFKIGDVRYGNPHEEDDLPIIDERRLRLRDLLEPGLEFTYVYDFGDHWVHTVRVELAEPQEEPYGAASVVAGARACPPEDCGGVPGYQAFLDQRRVRRQSKEVQAFLEWAGEDFDPDLYDRRGANAALLRMAWNGWGKK